MGNFNNNQAAEFIVGRQPVIEALKQQRAIDKILLQENASGEPIYTIRSLAREANIPVQVVPAAKFASITKGNHQGVAAVVSTIVYQDLETVIARTIAEDQTPLIVMLDGITDVRNIGGIARSCLCCGVHALVLPDKGVGALNADAMKASAGALQHLAVCRVNSLLKAVDFLHSKELKVFTSIVNAPKLLGEIDLRVPACIIMGSEDKGVQPYLQKAADEGFRIPMPGRFDSFNVSVATGIILYEAVRQRSA
jgi:23S rRNA (guanosine2251-2'-O)-methyltransferase